MSQKARQLITSPFLIVTAALALRLTILWWSYRHIGPNGSSEPYGYEEGNVAKSIASGQGFSSPLWSVDTGPTAYLCPIYPYLLAAIFKVWGVLSFESRCVAEGLNCIFSAITIFPIFYAARRVFGIAIGASAAWLWVILPTAWHMPIAYVWDTSLSALMLAALFWATIAVSTSKRIVHWAVYGLLWAIAALTNASIASLLPFFLVWLGLRIHREGRRWPKCISATLFLFVIGIAPWMTRNYRVFHSFIPFRSNLGLMLWLGNNPVAVDIEGLPLTAWENPAEADLFKRLGEIDYMRLKQEQALAFIRNNPGQTISDVARRAAEFWFSISDRSNNSWSTEPAHLKALFVFNAAMVVLAWFGVGVSLRTHNVAAGLFFSTVLIFPLIYYVTSTLLRYRFAIDPIMTILAVYGAARIIARLTQKDRGTFNFPVEEN